MYVHRVYSKVAWDSTPPELTAVGLSGAPCAETMRAGGGPARFVGVGVGAGGAVDCLCVVSSPFRGEIGV